MMRQFTTGLFVALGLAYGIPAGVSAQDITLRPQLRPAALAEGTAEAASPDALAASIAAAMTATTGAPVRPIIPPAPSLPDATALAAPEEATEGMVTGLPLPRFVSLKSDDVNVRRGPSLSHRVDWVFTRTNMPLMVTGEYGHWRRVIDREGLGGWIHYALLSGTRTVIVDTDMQPLYARPDVGAPQNALVEAGVVARLEQCTIDWCRISTGGYRGWAPKSALWGIGADEVLD